jgi:O-antigen chain-terminating methyltransferase
VIATDIVALLKELLRSIGPMDNAPGDDRPLREVVNGLGRSGRDSAAAIEMLERRLAEQVAAVDELKQRLSQSEQLRTKTAALGSQLSALLAALPVVDQRLALAEKQLAQAGPELGGCSRRIATLEGAMAELRPVRAELDACSSRLARAESATAMHTQDLRALAEKSNDVLARLVALRKDTGLPSPEEQATFDDFYLAFENAFRGSEAEISRKQAIYASAVGRAFKDAGCMDWLDLGCGRGEWLNLVASVGGTPTGVDTNPRMVAHCRARGFNAAEGDAVAALRSVAPGTLAGVSAFHLIEHIPAHEQVLLVRHAFASLRPGGCLILETPNPQNVTVGACNFYMDPTHRNPVPPMTAEFLARNAGFASVEVLRLNAFPRYAERDSLTSVADREMCEFFYGPQDYAIVAFK